MIASTVGRHFSGAGALVARPGQSVDRSPAREISVTDRSAAYAAFWLAFGMVTFKGFCRWVCPLGAVMAIGGLLRGRDWIARRAECGSPCQLCRVRCNYGAITRTGKINYSECFQCLDCVKIHDDATQCVPLVLAARRADRVAAE